MVRQFLCFLRCVFLASAGILRLSNPASESGVVGPDLALVEFVGLENSDSWELVRLDDGRSSAVPILTRPSWIKTFRCGESYNSCEECWESEECWTGSKGGRLAKANTSKWTRFVNSIHVSCKSEVFELWYHIASLKSGDFRVLWDGEEVAKVSSTNISSHPFSMVRKLNLPIEREGGHKLDLEFLPTGEDAHVELSKLRMLMTESYTRCEDFRMCLHPLMTANKEHRKFRNVNEMQLQCLLVDVPQDAACRSWRACLKPKQERNLLLLLNASQDSSSSTLRRPNSSPKLESLCIDPAIDDVQSWNCDCFTEMQSKCVRIKDVTGYSETACLRAQMCAHQRVCDHWKADIGCDGDQLSVLRDSLRQRSAAPKQLRFDQVEPEPETLDRAPNHKRCV